MSGKSVVIQSIPSGWFVKVVDQFGQEVDVRYFYNQRERDAFIAEKERQIKREQPRRERWQEEYQ